MDTYSSCNKLFRALQEGRVKTINRCKMLLSPTYINHVLCVLLKTKSFGSNQVRNISEHLQMDQNDRCTKILEIICSNNNTSLLFIEKLINNNTIKNIPVSISMVLKYACQSENILLVNECLEQLNDIDAIFYNEVFDTACSSGNIELITLLLKRNSNIITPLKNNKYFKDACINNYVALAQLLCTINDNYHIEIKNNMIVNYHISINYISTIVETTSEICCVCLEEPDLKTGCRHYGCSKCFIQLNNLCPMCRQTIHEYHKLVLQ